MPSDRFASRAVTASGRARATAAAFVVLVAVLFLLSGPLGSPPAAPSASATASGTPAASASAAVIPAPSTALLGDEWAVLPDLSGLAGIGKPAGLAAGAQGLVATGMSGVAWSADGATWTPVPRAPLGVPVVATAGGWFALGDGLGWSSADGRTWVNVDAPEARGFVIRGIVAAGSELLAVGALRSGGDGWGAVFRSTDGWTWQREGGSLPPFDLIAASGTAVVAAVRVPQDVDRVAVRLSDGTWTDLAPLPGEPEVTALAGSSDGFLAGGTVVRDGRVVTLVWASDDGLAWREIVGSSAIQGAPARIVATADGLLVATGEPTGFWRWGAASGWTAAAEVPSFLEATPAFVASTGRGLVALGSTLAADERPLAWGSPPFRPEPRTAELALGSWSAAESLPCTSDGDRLVALPDGSLVLLGCVRPSVGVPQEAVAPVIAPYSADVWRRDPAGGWSPRTPMPGSRVQVVATVAADGRVWLVGGVLADGDGMPTSRVDIYDPATDRWSRGPDLPAEVASTDAIAMPDGSVIAVGPGPGLWRARPGDASWRLVARTVWEAYGVSAGRLPDGSILLVGTGPTLEPDPASPGGMRQVLALAAIAMDPSSGAVRPRRAPDGTGATQGVLVELGDGRLALAGQAGSARDSGQSRSLRRIDVYEADRDVWRLLTMEAAPRLSAGIAAGPGGRLWSGGGEGPAQADDTFWMPTDFLEVWTPPQPSRLGGR